MSPSLRLEQAMAELAVGMTREGETNVVQISRHIG